MPATLPLSRRLKRGICRIVCALVIAQIIVQPRSARASDAQHSCVILNGGGTFCWGNNAFGQSGQSITTSPLCSVTDGGQVTSSSCVLRPSAVIGLPATAVVKNFAMGHGHTCSIADVGVVRCWGRNTEGQVGNGGASSTCAVGSSNVACVLTPTVIPMEPCIRLTAGASHTCAATEGQVLCWGWNPRGQVGDGTVAVNRPTPTIVLGGDGGAFNAISIACGGLHSCAVSSTGTLWCWGDNEHGQIGDGTVLVRLSPVAIASVAGVMSAVSAGSGHTCGITKTGSLKCWGQNNYGQLGQGSTSSYLLTPTDVPGIADLVALSLGAWHTCAVTMDGKLYCWGLNDFGQLGLPAANAACGTVGSSSPCIMSPTQVAIGVSGIATGHYHTCAIVHGGSVSCWGYNAYGQLGDLSVTRRDTMTSVAVPPDSLAVISLWDSSRTGKVSRGSFKLFPASGRVAGTPNIIVVVSFKLSTSGALPSGSSMTIIYPDNFFQDGLASARTPADIGSDLERYKLPELECSAPRTNILLIRTIGQDIPSGTTVTITLSGLQMGKATKGGDVVFSTSSDPSSSQPVPSGPVGGSVTQPSLIIVGRRVSGMTVTALVSFVTSAGGAMAQGSTVTLYFPAGFFVQTSVAPNLVFSSPSGIHGVASPPGSNFITFTTTSSGQINETSLVNCSLSNLVLGLPRANDKGGILIRTTSDPLNSSSSETGHIGGSVTVTSFDMASFNRVQLKYPVELVVAFTTSPGGALAVGATITLTYPPNFFNTAQSDLLPQVSGLAANSSSASGSCSCFILTIAGGSVGNSASVAVTIAGLRNGPATEPNATGVTVHTSIDTIPGAGFNSGGLYGQPVNVTFVIDKSLRCAGSVASCALTFVMASDLPSGGSVTVRYPSAFFRTGVVPTVAASSFQAISGSTSDSTVVLRLLSGSVVSGRLTTVTLSGLTMGLATAGSSTGIAVSSTTDPAESNGIPSGPIGNMVLDVDFKMSATDRIASKSGVAVTLSFSVSVGGALDSSSTITFKYPSNFFVPSAEPTVNASSALTVQSAATTATSIVMTINSGSVASAAKVSLTLSGLTMGPDTAGVSSGMKISTSADLFDSSGVPTGVIGDKVTDVGFKMYELDRVALKTYSTATVTFKVSAGGALSTNSTITIAYPANFFASSPAPSVSASSDLVVRSEVPATSAVVLTVSSGSSPSAGVVSLTLFGLTMGPSTYGSTSGITVQTSVDLLVSSAAASGPIESYVNSVSLAIAAGDRISMKSNVSVTLSFKTTKELPASGNITVVYPLNFFASGVVPFVTSDATSVSGLQISCFPTSRQLLLMTTRGAAVPVSTFTVTISGMTMGASGAHIQQSLIIWTSADKAASVGVDSGMFSCPAGYHWTGDPPTCTPCKTQTYQSLPDQKYCQACLLGVIAPVASIVCQPLGHDETVLVLSGSIDTFQEGSPRRALVLEGLASILDIPLAQILVISVTSGSVILELAFLSEWTLPYWPFEVIRAAASPADAFKRLQAAATSGRLDGFGVTQMKVAGKSVYSTDIAPPFPVLYVSLAGGGALLLIVIGAIVWWKKRARMSLQTMFVGSIEPGRRASVFSSVDDNYVGSHMSPATRAPAHADISFKFYEIDPSHLSNIIDVSAGTQRCQWNGIDVLLKRVSASPSADACVRRAREVSQISHPNCTRLFGTCRNPDLLLVEEWPDGLVLTEFLHGKHRPSRRCRLDLSVQICSALQHMHGLSSPVTHSSIQSSNIFVSPDGQIAKVSSSSAVEFESVTALKMRYIAPEILTGKRQVSSQSDVYSLGILLWELLTADVAWSGLNPSQISAAVTSGQRPAIFPKVAPLYAAIVTECWAEDPVRRPSAATVWLQLYTLVYRELRENTPLRLLPAGFSTSFVAAEECLRGALPARLFRAIMFDLSMINEFYSTPHVQQRVNMHGLSDVEAKCIMLYAHVTYNIATHPVHLEYNQLSKSNQLHSIYAAACRDNDETQIAKFEHFSFYFLSALQKLPDVSLGSRGNMYVKSMSP
jgi:alpha-tubulin suppressor-like RCC1 family protein/serine/threonine protein kinase